MHYGQHRRSIMRRDRNVIVFRFHEAGVAFLSYLMYHKTNMKADEKQRKERIGL